MKQNAKKHENLHIYQPKLIDSNILRFPYFYERNHKKRFITFQNDNITNEEVLILLHNDKADEKTKSNTYIYTHYNNIYIALIFHNYLDLSMRGKHFRAIISWSEHCTQSWLDLRHEQQESKWDSSSTFEQEQAVYRGDDKSIPSKRKWGASWDKGRNFHTDSILAQPFVE